MVSISQRRRRTLFFNGNYNESPRFNYAAQSKRRAARLVGSGSRLGTYKLMPHQRDALTLCGVTPLATPTSPVTVVVAVVGVVVCSSCPLTAVVLNPRCVYAMPALTLITTGSKICREGERETILSQVTRSVLNPSAPISIVLGSCLRCVKPCGIALSHRIVSHAPCGKSSLFEPGKKVSSSPSDSFE